VKGERLDDYVSTVVARNPYPPRQFQRKTLLRRVLGTRTSKLLIGASAFFVAGIVFLEMTDHGGIVGRFIATAVGLGLTIVALSSVALIFRRIDDALTRGLLTTAAVRSHRVQLGTTLEGVNLTGMYLVKHPAGNFEARFEIDRPWARLVRDDSVLEVLVDPHEPKVLLPVRIR